MNTLRYTAGFVAGLTTAATIAFVALLAGYIDDAVDRSRQDRQRFHPPPPRHRRHHHVTRMPARWTP